MTGREDPGYLAWETTVPTAITHDVIWKLPAYRLGLYLASSVADDARRVQADPRTRGAADQLVRAVGSIAANIAEGYGRSSGRERAHFYEYALGSAREARDWYFLVHVALPEELLSRRLATLSRIARILTAVIPRERGQRLSRQVPPK